MNVIAHRSELSGYYMQINVTTVFYSFPRDAKTSLRKGLNAICELGEIGQCFISKARDSDHEKLNTAVQ